MDTRTIIALFAQEERGVSMPTGVRLWRLTHKQAAWLIGQAARDGHDTRSFGVTVNDRYYTVRPRGGTYVIESLI